MEGHEENNLKIFSYNVNGLIALEKRNKSKAWLEMENFDIIFLQETHIPVNKITEIKKFWQGLSIWLTN